jgi:DNA primase
VIEHEDEKRRPGRRSKRYDRFRDRIMFPIRNVKGECIGFGGRVLDKGEPKYLNSPETPVFSKGRSSTACSRPAPPSASRLCAGDRGLHGRGGAGAAGLCQRGGHAGHGLHADHVHKLFRFTDAVVFSFDGDAAGRRAARKALDAALPWPPTRAASSSCSCRPSTTPTATSANGAGPEAVPLSVPSTPPGRLRP